LANNKLGPKGGKAIAECIRGSRSLTSIDVRHNSIAGDGASQLSAAVLANLKIEKFNEIPIKEMRADSITELNLNREFIGIVGGMVVAGLMPVMGSLTTIGRNGIDLKDNKLGATGWGTIFAAVCSSAECKITSIDASAESLGVEGAKSVATALQNSVSRSLTHIE